MEKRNDKQDDHSAKKGPSKQALPLSEADDVEESKRRASLSAIAVAKKA